MQDNPHCSSCTCHSSVLSQNTKNSKLRKTSANTLSEQGYSQFSKTHSALKISKILEEIASVSSGDSPDHFENKRNSSIHLKPISKAKKKRSKMLHKKRHNSVWCKEQNRNDPLQDYSDEFAMVRSSVKSHIQKSHGSTKSLRRVRKVSSIMTVSLNDF
ncbi:unnamed protein product [Moneuplotes crassus]|uniref:Uncharacterized protein n=1 Tax=Euplotes crassus TaxID=5936 RepID=A0AAD2CYI8_EUPCR|nr:unnamed protein product [Moneuplotes crassus]